MLSECPDTRVLDNTSFTVFITPQPLRVVPVLFSPMVSERQAGLWKNLVWAVSQKPLGVAYQYPQINVPTKYQFPTPYNF